MNKTAFLSTYAQELQAAHVWANDPDRLSRFMHSCEQTLNGKVATWNHDGEACVKAWRTIGGKGKPTLKALRALPTA